MLFFVTEIKFLGEMKEFFVTYVAHSMLGNSRKRNYSVDVTGELGPTYVNESSGFLLSRGVKRAQSSARVTIGKKASSSTTLLSSSPNSSWTKIQPNIKPDSELEIKTNTENVMDIENKQITEGIDKDQPSYGEKLIDETVIKEDGDIDKSVTEITAPPLPTTKPMTHTPPKLESYPKIPLRTDLGEKPPSEEEKEEIIEEKVENIQNEIPSPSSAKDESFTMEVQSSIKKEIDKRPTADQMMTLTGGILLLVITFQVINLILFNRFQFLFINKKRKTTEDLA